MLTDSIDVRTGEVIKGPITVNSGSHLNHPEPAWWIVTYNLYTDVHGVSHHEVSLHNVTRLCKTPTWPILRVQGDDEARVWKKRLIEFAKTISPMANSNSAKYNGDGRLGVWLEGHGFEKEDNSSWRIKDICERCCQHDYELLSVYEDKLHCSSCLCEKCGDVLEQSNCWTCDRCQELACPECDEEKDSEYDDLCSECNWNAQEDAREAEEEEDEEEDS